MDVRCSQSGSGRKPCTATVASIVAAVIVPAASLVRLNVSVVVPEPFASLPLTGGTSLDGRNAAVNMTDDAGEGVVGILLSEPQAAARTPSPSNPKTVSDFMSDLLVK